MIGTGRRIKDESPPVVFFGGYDPLYPRNSIIRKGLERIGVVTGECRASTKRKVHTRYPVLAWKYLSGKKGKILFVPDFRHKDVPLAYILSRVTGGKVVFDPLVSRYETRVLDRGDASDGSAQAWHNRNIDRVSMSLADLVLADTGAHANFYSSEFKIPRRKIETLYLGFDDEIFRPAPAPPVEKIVKVLFYGSYLPLHGVETIIEAAGLLDSHTLEITLVGGGQTFGQVKERANGLRDGAVIFREFMSQNELVETISRSHIVLGVFGTTPKTGMVIPNKVFQAMAVGRPVITAGTPAIEEIFRPEHDILTIPAGNPKALADAVERLAEDGGLRNRIAENGSQAVCDRFNPPRIAEKLLSLLEHEGIFISSTFDR
ncbi:MAG: glycosyltransferase family 4 protein [Bacteroidales bacterium]|nr:glycosyltransferase family 4 protein [Candidatus Latescibacterota bacterium]